MTRPRYHVNLSQYMHDCEMSYAKMHRLLGDRGINASFSFYLQQGKAPFAKVSIDHIENHVFTDQYSLLIEYELNSSSSSPIHSATLLDQAFTPLLFRVKLCHDAKVLDIEAFQGCQVVIGNHVYPNTQMHQKNEKHALQRFLLKCFSLIEAFGIADTAHWSSQTPQS